jgi:hypothetical protein
MATENTHGALIATEQDGAFIYQRYLELHREQILLYSYQCVQWAINEWLAKRPASWNAEQIRAAAARNSIWSGTAEMIVACLVEQHTPKPKTAEERVTEVLEYEFNENLPVTYSEVAAKIVAALKESEAYNG